MKIIANSIEIQNEITQIKLKGKKIGFVPTMGALHEGHLSLIRESKKENDIVVVSIFVNPKQFGPKEDFSKYPRTHKEDIILCEKENVEYLFLPEENSFYLKDHLTYVEVENISNLHCGKSRPGHFKGVTTVVLKLFNIVQPDNAYFGKKDFQQLIIIKKMVEDLSLPIKIIGCPIIRDKDGLALSSRNKYLSDEERKVALLLSKSLLIANEKIIQNITDPKAIYDYIFKNLSSNDLIKIDYISIVDDKYLMDVQSIQKNTVILIACYVGSTRLIDNLHCADFL